MRLLDILTQGGPVMYCLSLFSVIALAIVLLKIFEFTIFQLRRDNFIHESLSLLIQGNQETAIKRLLSEKNPIAAVLATTIQMASSQKLSESDTEKEIIRIGTNTIRGLESWLRGLAAIAHLSPLLGLLGTVLGMISAFMELEGAGARIDPSLLAGGIWEALLTTAFGLAIAIPAMAAYYYLEGVVDQAKADMQDGITRILLFFRETQLSNTDQEITTQTKKRSYGI